MKLVPSIVRARPERSFVFVYRTVDDASLPPDLAERLAVAFRTAGAHVEHGAGGAWRLELPWRTLVYGFIRRDVDESVSVEVRRLETGPEVVVECEPIQTHGAHAAGVGGVLLLAALVWLAMGWTSGGVLPGLTTLAAGGLLADVTRVRAFELFERRLRALAADVGSALWPRVPAEIVEGTPHPPGR